MCGVWLLTGLSLAVVLMAVLGLLAWRYSDIPGGLGRPGPWQLWAALHTAYSPLSKLMSRIDSLMEQHGDIVSLWMGPLPIVAVADPELIQAIAYNQATVNKEPLVYDKINVVAVGAFTKSQTDAEWKHFRKIINHSMRKEHMEKFQEVFIKRSVELVSALRGLAQPVDALPLLILHALDNILETNFGLDFHELDNRNLNLSYDIINMEIIFSTVMTNPLHFLTAKPIILYYMSKSKHLLDYERQYYQALMENMKHIENEDDEVPQAAKIVLENKRNGISQKQTVHELREIVFVGGTTTGELLSWLLMFLAMYPDVQEKVWKEQERIYGNSDRPACINDFKEMTYLKMAVKEAARHVAGPMLPRRCSENAKIGKYTIPSHTILLLYSYKMRMDPRYWERPKEFYPEHYLPEKVLARPKWADLSFGVLPRHCPGANYSLDLCRVIVSSVIRNFKLSTKLKHDEIVIHPVIMMSLKAPYLIYFEPRVP